MRQLHIISCCCEGAKEILHRIRLRSFVPHSSSKLLKEEARIRSSKEQYCSLVQKSLERLQEDYPGAKPKLAKLAEAIQRDFERASDRKTAQRSLEWQVRQLGCKNIPPQLLRIVQQRLGVFP